MVYPHWPGTPAVAGGNCGGRGSLITRRANQPGAPLGRRYQIFDRRTVRAFLPPAERRAWPGIVSLQCINAAP